MFSPQRAQAPEGRVLRSAASNSPCQEGTPGVLAAPWWLEIVRELSYQIARVTLLATIASATHASRSDLKFIDLISHQKFAARVITGATRNSARAVTPGGCLADTKTARKALIADSTSGAKG
jgi:hypothetical protein